MSRRDSLKGINKVLNTEVVVDDCYLEALEDEAIPFLNAHIKRLTKAEANEKMSVLVEIAALEHARSELIKSGVLKASTLFDKEQAILVTNFNKLLQKLHECYRILGIKAPTRLDNAKKSRDLEKKITKDYEGLKEDSLLLS